MDRITNKAWGVCQDIRDSKKNSRKDIARHTGIKVDIPDAAGKGGTTTDGSVCERLLKDHRLDLVLLVPERF